MKEKYHLVVGGGVKNDDKDQKTKSLTMTLILMIVLVMVVVMGVLTGIMFLDYQNLKQRVDDLEENVFDLREMLDQETILEFERSRRDALYPGQYNAESPVKEKFSEFTEDGIPVVSRKYRGFNKDRTGFRVYNAWYQHRRENKIKNDPRVVVQHPTDAPIRPHHRKSAAWSGGNGNSINDQDDEDQFLKFGDSMYSDSGARSRASAQNSVSYTRNRAKITNIQNYRDENRFTTTTTTSTTASTTTTASSVGLNDHMRSKMSQEASRRDHHNRGARNRHGLKSGGAAVERSHANKHVTAIHLEGDPAGTSGGSGSGGLMKVTDGVYRDWTVSRWARRLHMDRRITLRDGVLTVSSPGIYFIYAQINYLDNHEVNAYQILVNDSPWLMCTTMTHTPDPTTKANTCYTGGVRFLEQGDKLKVKNTDNNRFAVMLPSHSFFGLVQMTNLGM